VNEGDPVERSDALDGKIAASSDITALTRASKRNWLLIRILGISVALDLLLSVGVGYLAWQAQGLAAQANSIEQRARATCLAGNEARAGQIQLWHYVLDLPPSMPRTPEQQAQVDAVRAYIDHLFAPRVCGPPT
jgi:hypothetical protein